MIIFFFHMQLMFRIFHKLSSRMYKKIVQAIPGFDKVVEKVKADSAARVARRKEKLAARRRG